jgi:putative nucleotidyltransferase with HDIG domain
MKRILFVDDEPAVLEELQRTLGPQNPHWEIATAPNGEAALTLLDATLFDVVVADAHMPGMDGAALLKQVRERFPAVVRIALCSENELAASLRAIPVAHQFLVKPCDPAMLRVAIERATSLSNVLDSKLMAITVGSVQDLPVVPRTYFELRDKLADPAATIEDVVRLVEQDVGISAKILQLVNSPVFGLPHEISTVQTAASYLGIGMIQNLVLSAEVFRVFEEGETIPGFSIEEVQLHSQLVARIAGEIPAPAHIRSAAIVAGLLHDVGKLVLARNSPKHLARAVSGSLEEKKPLFEIEEQLIGVSHAEIGAYLLGIWGLPSSVVEAVAHHHRPERVPLEELDAVGIVHIANALAHLHPPGPPLDSAPVYQALDIKHLERIGVAHHLSEWEEIAKAAAEEIRGSVPVR